MKKKYKTTQIDKMFDIILLQQIMNAVKKQLLYIGRKEWNNC